MENTFGVLVLLWLAFDFFFSVFELNGRFLFLTRNLFKKLVLLVLRKHSCRLAIHDRELKTEIHEYSIDGKDRGKMIIYAMKCKNCENRRTSFHSMKSELFSGFRETKLKENERIFLS